MKIIDINSIPRNLSADHKEKEIVDPPKGGKRKWYVIGIGLILLAAAVYFGFLYLKESKNVQAQDDVFQAIYHFEAGDFDKALKGDGVNKGLLEVIKQYPYTATANLACFYAGIAYMHQKEYDQVRAFLSRFKVNDYIVQARAWCVMGDAYSEQKNHKQAAIYYMKAARYKANSVYTPGYLVKAAVAFEADAQYKNAYDCYQEIVEKYPISRYGSGLAIKEASRLSGLC
ncbi:MAG: cytochrome C biosynthesis protein [Candidatus Cardinium sp.]|uniref:tetratricopeptide repeat protein n=1 Tax=Cardinium endosymbiont of Dermatophagoides farinae TaxID=2597823 RepID=UPI001182FBCB|nr:cytochrome C biosynthesis protein [Cardinium endosymbiont of Dermatophagoides farinae]TSJ81433.1 cytochrome C biosynthesis protein [Cardinium endosymbiont of Dermatophagoides farinae]UWW97496.1 MAG: cytochrome C biosynthesis protein [Candidatus Cardinium sp.]